MINVCVKIKRKTCFTIYVHGVTQLSCNGKHQLSVKGSRRMHNNSMYKIYFVTVSSNDPIQHSSYNFEKTFSQILFPPLRWKIFPQIFYRTTIYRDNFLQAIYILLLTSMETNVFLYRYQSRKVTILQIIRIYILHGSFRSFFKLNVFYDARSCCEFCQT